MRSLQVRQAVPRPGCPERSPKAGPCDRPFEDCSPRGTRQASAVTGICLPWQPLRNPWQAVRGNAARRRHRCPPGPRVSPVSSNPGSARENQRRTPLGGDETGKVGGTSRPRPRSSTFAPSCRRPPSSFPVSRRSGHPSGDRRVHSVRVPIDPSCCCLRSPDVGRDPVGSDEASDVFSQAVPFHRLIDRAARR